MMMIIIPGMNGNKYMCRITRGERNLILEHKYRFAPVISRFVVRRHTHITRMCASLFLSLWKLEQLPFYFYISTESTVSSVPLFSRITKWHWSFRVQSNSAFYPSYFFAGAWRTYIYITVAHCFRAGGWNTSINLCTVSVIDVRGKSDSGRRRVYIYTR